MARLAVKTDKVQLPSGAIAVEGSLGGTMDITTMAIFEKEMADLMKANIPYYYFDCGKLEYINSSGMGLLLQLSDKLAGRGGKILFYNIPKKIEALIKMLGLHNVLKLYGSRDEVLAEFTKKDGVAPAKPLFPMQIHCAQCAVELELPEPGKFRCPTCNEYYEVAADGKFVSFSSTRLRFLEMKIPLEPSFLPSLIDLARALFQSVPLEDQATQELAQAIDEFCNYLLAWNAARKAGIPLCHIAVIADTDEARIVFQSPNVLIENLQTQLQTSPPLKVASSLVERIEVIGLPKGGQLVTLIKRYAKVPVA